MHGHKQADLAQDTAGKTNKLDIGTSLKGNNNYARQDENKIDLTKEANHYTYRKKQRIRLVFRLSVNIEIKMTCLVYKPLCNSKTTE